MSGGVSSLLADLTQDGIVSLSTGGSQQLSCSIGQWQGDMNEPNEARNIRDYGPFSEPCDSAS
jgi:hypothetical protein